mgnify:CR=1 FL=1
MKSIKFALLATSLLTLAACDSKPIHGNPLGYDKNTVSFMLNYNRTSVDTESGNTIITENLLYEQKEIVLNELIEAPEQDPIRINYEFRGWFKEKTCENEWNFEVDKPTHNLFLYAKWGKTAEEEYVEPDYVYPERIITESNIELTGILNMPIVGGSVKLSTGAIKRLRSSNSDVKFALNYGRKQGVSISSAVFDETLMKITVNVSSGESFEVTVVDNSAALNIQNENATFETKASNYEEADKEFENYHIVLAGSSSMEYWTESKNDLDPIVTTNHGIGGTTVEQWTDKLNERLVYPYSPKAVVYYVGVNNIINSGNNGQTTGNKIVTLMNSTHEHLPNTRIFFVLINKLPGFADKQPEFDVCNSIVEDYCSTREWISCIDAGTILLKPNGLPNAAYFRTDGLHMSQYGYVLWGNEVRKELINWLG